ncbi:HIT family protein [Micromonospora musae]|uniref:HIT family protein n=1 Tax=Micromonospora musae TaxID=1894970 RepID=UPI00340B5C50
MEGESHCSGSDLCEELAGTTRTSFSLTYGGDPPSRTIVDGGRLKLIADMSPLLLGHMLIVPAKHYLSFGHAAREIAADIQHFLDFVLARYRSAFGASLILEHGSSSDMTAAACITHAHWHLVPLDGVQVHRLIVEDGFSIQDLRSFADLERYADADAAYFYSAFDDRHVVYVGDFTTRRQYLRSTMARVLGIPDPLWDYAVAVRKDLLRETMRLAGGWDSETPFPRRVGQSRNVINIGMDGER